MTPQLDVLWIPYPILFLLLVFTCQLVYKWLLIYLVLSFLFVQKNPLKSSSGLTSSYCQYYVTERHIWLCKIILFMSEVVLNL